MPELGDNAIYKAAKSIATIEKFRFMAEKDPLLGLPTINVGKMQGGLNINSVPDRASFTMDIRYLRRIGESAAHQVGEVFGIAAMLETPGLQQGLHTTKLGGISQQAEPCHQAAVRQIPEQDV